MPKQTKLVPAAHPFLKWAGGKTQLLNEFSKRLPLDLKKGKIIKYIEPFIGGGAFYFYLNQRFSFTYCYICDVNEELILAYRVIKRSTKKLIDELAILQDDYLSLDEIGRENFYYDVRDSFNGKHSKINFKKFGPEWLERTAQIIFLNRKCYNGLFRMNRKGEFNVPFGRYKNPETLNEDKPPDPKEPVKASYAKGEITKACEQALRNANASFDAIAQTPAKDRTPGTPAHHPDECLIGGHTNLTHKGTQ